jgi:hypothetical protein
MPATRARQTLLQDVGLLDRELGSMEVRQQFNAREIAALSRELQRLREAAGTIDPDAFGSAMPN